MSVLAWIVIVGGLTSFAAALIVGACVIVSGWIVED
jgi:hypothetical protein